jgi:1-phosphofructokinase family hexose kinase
VVILSAGLSPAWQQIIELQTLMPGEVNRARSVTWCGSGKVVNTAIAVATLGGQSRLIAPAGGLTGQALMSDVSGFPLTADWIPVSLPTRVCTTLLPAQAPATELVENMGPLQSAELQNFCRLTHQAATQADCVILTGSLPEQAPTTLFQNLVRQSADRCLLDLRGEVLLACLPERPLLVKPNRAELQTTLSLLPKPAQQAEQPPAQNRPQNSTQNLNGNLDEPEAWIAGLRALQALGAQWVLITDGAQAAWLAGPDCLLRFHPPPVHVANPIGCGDSLTAGIALQFAQGESLPEAVRFGMGAAASNAEQLLPARLDFDRAAELSRRVRVEKIG